MHCRLHVRHLQTTVFLKRRQDALVRRLVGQVRASANASSGSTKRFAILGGGFAGVATAHHLAAAASVTQPVAIHLYDLAGLGSGGSGAAGGLLHPFSPKGKLLWKGQEAFEAALDLIAAAEHASQQQSVHTEAASEQFVWRQDILRPAADSSQAAGFEALQIGPVGKHASMQVVNRQQAESLLPGLQPSALPPSSAGSQDAAVGLLIQGGLVLHPERYLRHLWQGCKRLLAQLDNGSEASLRLQQVHSLASLEQQHGPYDAVVVAAGAAVGTLPEVGDLLPLRLSQGYGLELVPPSASCASVPTTSHPSPISAAASQPQHSASSVQPTEPTHQDSAGAGSLRASADSPVAPGKLGSDADVQDPGVEACAGKHFPAGSPSLVGATYMGVQGGQQISVGATKQFGWTPQQALQQCGRRVTDAEEVQQAEALLRPRAEGLWEPASSWSTARVRSGVRALPQKTVDGAIPLAGKLPSSSEGHNWWIVGGLGARGLVYHAWLGKLVAEGILKGTEEGLPSQLLRWKISKQKKR